LTSQVQNVHRRWFSPKPASASQWSERHDVFQRIFATILEKGNVSGQVFVEDPTQQQDSAGPLGSAVPLAKKMPETAVCIESLGGARAIGMFPN